MSRVALIGANGQLGSDITRLWPESNFGRRGDDLIGLMHSDIEVTDAAMVRSVLTGMEPALVINTAAFHDIDQCETDPLTAYQVNGLGVKYLAETCKELGATLVHFSNNCVFDGEKTRPYVENDATGPISAYGISELAGEGFLRYTLPDNHLLVRSAGLYGAAGASGKGGNFVETVLRSAREGGPIRVVTDQVTSPTYTLDLAETLLQVIAAGGRGTYHITNAGACSWMNFAQEIFRLTGGAPELVAISSDEAGDAARRPMYSVMASKRLSDLGIEAPGHWREALESYLRQLGRISA